MNNTSGWNDSLTTELPIKLLDLEDVQNIFTFIYISIYLFGLIAVSFYAICKEKNKNTKRKKYCHNNSNNNKSNNSGILYLNIRIIFVCLIETKTQKLQGKQ